MQINIVIDVSFLFIVGYTLYYWLTKLLVFYPKIFFVHKLDSTVC